MSKRKEEEVGIPAFLRRKRTSKPPVQPTGGGDETSARVAPKVERVQLTEHVRLAETVYEETGFALNDGVLPRRWYSGDPEGPEVMRLHLRMEELRVRREAKEEREARPERVHKYAGLLTLDDVVARIKGGADIALAKQAVRKARLPHERWHFAPDIVQTAVNVIRDYKPGETRTARRSEFPPSARIAWRGKNPKREGSDAFARWEMLKQANGKTVAEFLAAGGNPTTLKNAVQKKHVKLGETDGDTGREGGNEIQREGGEGVRQGSGEADPVAQGERDRGRDAGGHKARKPRAGRARRHR